MKLALLYAGQGSQKPGMGRDFYDEFPEVREIFDYRPLELELRTLCFDAELAELSRTEHTQPAMGAFAAAVTRLLNAAGVAPDFAIGLSLGEYGALHSAGAFDWRTLLELLAFRGRAMAQASERVDFKMSAVLCDDSSVAERAVADVGGDVWCCNYNCPGQTVIGGERSAVERAESRALELGAKRCMALNVGGPFHTPFMQPASEQLGEFMQTLEFEPLRFPVIFNVTGAALSSGETVAELLARQVMSPVRFETGVRTLVECSVDTTLEIGPGKVLSGFVRKIAPQVKTLNIETVADLRSVLEIVKGA